MFGDEDGAGGSLAQRLGQSVLPLGGAVDEEEPLGHTALDLVDKLEQALLIGVGGVAVHHLDFRAELPAGTEVIVVDDASDDDTAAVAREHGARVVHHPHAVGNGGAIKAGARIARGERIAFLDGDGQHDPAVIPDMLARMDAGYRMVVGARTRGSQASVGRQVANGFYNRVASLVSGQRIDDLTSGFRVVEASLFRSYLHLLPNGFSYPTTITMSFLRSGFPVGFHPIEARPRIGTSHIRPLRDGLRFLLIIFRIATLYSPLKIFVPASAALFTTGIAYYSYTYITDGRFTNMSALLFITAVIVFLIGLVSEQITALMHQQR